MLIDLVARRTALGSSLLVAAWRSLGGQRRRRRNSTSPARGRPWAPKTCRTTRCRWTTSGSHSPTKAATRALSYDESQKSMIERQCAGWGAAYVVLGPFGLRVSSQTDPVTNRVVSLHDRRVGRLERDDHLDGRPPAPVRARASHAGRLHDRPLGRRRARRADDAREGGLHPQDRRAVDRSGHDRLALLPPRRRADGPDGGDAIRSISWSRKSSRRASGCRRRRSTTATRA